jgi:hypothetical protein
VTRAARIVYAAAAVIGLAAGIVLGFLSRSMRVIDSVRRISAVSEFFEFSYTQYTHADAEHASQALLSFISFLEQTERVAPDKKQEFDLAVAYTRLSFLEDAQNHPEQSREYMEKALSWEKTGSGRQYTADELKAAVRVVDLQLQRDRKSVV